MSPCSFLAPNGENSLLYAALEQNVGKAKAAKIWSQIQTEEFKAKYGDWEDSKSIPRDKNGEPTLDWVKEKTGFTEAEKAEQPAPEPIRYTLEHLTTSDKKTPLSEQSITDNIYKIYDEASADPTKVIHLDLPGNMKDNIKLADKSSISMLKLATIIDSRPIPWNIKLSDEFESVLQNTPRRFLSNLMFEDHSTYEPLPYDEKILQKQIDDTFVPVRDSDGKKTGGYFDAERQTEVVDSIIHSLHLVMGKAEATKTRYNVDQFKQIIKNNIFTAMRDNLNKIANGEVLKGYEDMPADRAAKLSKEFTDVINAFDTKGGLNFWKLSIDRLKDLQINMRENKFKKDTPDTARILPENIDMNFESDAGHGLSDWSDNHFEHDPKDTATGRLKMFIATIPDSVVGKEDQPRTISFSFSDPKTRDKILSGQKTFAARTAEQAEKLKLTKEGDEAIANINGKPFRITVLRKVDGGDIAVHGDNIKAEEGTDLKSGDVLYRLEPFTPKEAVLKTNKNYLGLTKLADFEGLFSDTLGKLAGQERSFDNYIKILKDEGNKFNPNLRALAERLEKAPTDIQNEFVSVVSLQYQPFTMVLLDTMRDTHGKSYFILRPINANRGSQLNVIIEGWQQNQKFSPILSRNEANITVVNREKATELKSELDQVNASYTSGDKQSDAKAMALLRKTLEFNGITMPEAAIQSFKKDSAKWTKKTSVAGDFRRQFAVSQDNKPLGVISSLIMKLSGFESDNDVLDTLEDKSFMLNNPLYTEGTATNILARVAAAHTPALYSNTHRSSEGKTIYDYGFNSSLSTAFRRLRTDDTYLDKFDDIDIAKNSFLVNHLKNSKDLRNKMSLSYLDGLKAVYRPGADGTTRPDMSDREQLLTTIGLFQNRGDSQFANYVSLTHSDKTTTPILMNMPRISNVWTTKIVEDKLAGRRVVPSISEEATTELMNVFHSEYDRIQRASQVKNYNNPKYEAGSKYFYFLPQFNHERLDPETRKKLYFDNGILKPKETPGFKETVQRLINRHIDDITNNTLNEWKKNDIITDGNTPFDRRYINRLLTGIGIKFDQVNPRSMYFQAIVAATGADAVKLAKGYYIGPDGAEIDDSIAHKHAAKLAAADYAINSFLMNTSMSQVLYGDPAQVWKGSVEKTMVEYGKRLAKDLAPGREGAWKPGETFVTINAKDFKTNAKYLGEIESLKKAYADGTPLEGSDAQELTTVQEHIYVMRAYGRISYKTYKEMSDIIEAANGGYYRFTDQHHRDVIMQPMKPVYVGDRAPQNGAILSDYIKSSSYPLYPEFTAGKELDKLRTAMEKGGVARVNFESARKIGNPSKPVDIFSADGTVNEKVFSESNWTGKDEHGNPTESARQVLARDGFRIQQDIPYDETKDSIRTVSQMNKLITQGIPEIKTTFKLGDRDVLAQELIQEKESIRKQLLSINRDKLFDEIGVKQTDKGLEFADRKKLFNALQKRVLEGDTGFTANDLAYFGEANMREHSDELTIPLMYAPSSAKFESLLMSMVSEIANVKMPGKSYIQASPAGQQSIGKFEDMTEEQKANTIWTEGYTGGPLKTLSKDGPAQVLVPFSFLVGSRPADINKYTKTLEDGRRIIDNDKIPKELLQLIGARIPNQGHNSMLPIEIVGFVPSNMGDLMIVPAAITKQMGSDFDVDKLYTYRRAYSHTDGKFSATIEGEDGLKNQYFETHWGVLNHPEMIEKILKPLDKPDLKNEAALIEKWEQKSEKPLDYYDPIYQLRDFQAQKAAKQLVALSSLNVTFDAVIQDKNIRPGYLSFNKDDGHVETSVPITIIDENGKTRKLTTLSGYGQSDYDGETRTKHDNHTTQQSEFLDYAKNKISDKVHLNTYTYPASAALTQLQEADSDSNGWATNLKFNSRLLSQPIIKEYAAEMAKRSDSLSGNYDPNLKKTVISDLVSKYINMARDAKESEEELDGTPVSFKDLTDSLQGKGDNFNLKQAKALKLFQQLDQIGGEMVRAQSTINHDTQGAGASLLDLISKDNTRDSITLPTGSSPDKLALLGTDSLYTNNNQETEQGFLYDTIHAAAYHIVGEFFPYKKLIPFFKNIMEHTNRQDLSTDMQKNVFNAVKSYLFSNSRLGLWENPEATRATLLFKRGDQPSLAERVHEAKNTWGQNNYFLQRLQLDIDPDNVHPSTIKYLASKASNLDEAENTRGWMNLLMSSDPKQQRLGEDLIRYSYITGGIQNANEFVRFVPYSYLLGTDFGFKLNELTKNLEEHILTNNFKTEWFQHNPQAALSLSPKMDELGGLEQYPERFTLPQINDETHGGDDDSNPASNLVVRTTTPNKVRILTYPDFLSYRSLDENKWVLYKKTSLSETTDPAYTRIDTLGDKTTDEYSFSEGMTRRSLIPENRSKAYDNLMSAPRMLNGAFSDHSLREVQKSIELPDEGNMEDMRKVLNHISTDNEIPNYTRVLSAFLAKTSDYNDNQKFLEIMIAKSSKLPELKFKVYNNNEFDKEFPGGYDAFHDSYSRTLGIRAGAIEDRDKSHAAMLINHELIHDRTALLTTMAESVDYLKKHGMPEEDIHAMKYNWEIAKRRFPGVEKAMNQLDEVRRQAEDKLRRQIERAGYNYDELHKQVMAGNGKTPFAIPIYAMSSNTEFIAHALSHKGVMKFLNQHQFDGKDGNFLSQVINIVKSMLSVIGEALGQRVEKGSLLEKAIQRSMDLMTTNQAIDLSASDLSSPNNIEHMFAHGALSSPVLTAIDRVAGKLEEQREEIIHSLTGRLPKAEAADKRSKLDQIETDIKKLRDEQDLAMVGEIGKKHLQWVDTVLKNPNPTESQIMTANRVLQTWSNLVDLVYGKDSNATSVDPAFADIDANAQRMRSQLAGKMRDALKTRAEGILVSADFREDNIKDMSKWQSLPRALSSAVSGKVVKYIATYIETVARHRDEENIRLFKWSKQMEQDMIGLAGGKNNLQNFYSKFMQENKEGNAFGLVQRFSQNWYDFRRSLKSRRQAELYRIEKSGYSSKDAGALKQQAWRKYWEGVNESAVFADTRMLFDEKTGDIKTDDRAKVHRAELEKEIGKDATDELISGAHDRYQQYLDRKQANSDNIDAEIAAGNKTEEDANREKTEFIHRYSPNVFFNNFKAKLGEFRDINTDYYAKMSPKRSVNNGDFYDSKFEEIQSSPQSKKIYDAYNAKLEELKEMLPVHIQQEMGANFLPVVHRRLVSDVINVKEYIKTMDDKIIRALTADDWEIERNDRKYNKIPIDYTDQDKVALEDRSKDLMRIIEAFGVMAHHYKHFADAKDIVDMGESILGEYNRNRSEGASQQVGPDGKVRTVKGNLDNTLEALRYLRDYHLYKKTRELEGVVQKSKLYSLNPIKQHKLQGEIKALLIEKDELQKKFVNGDLDPEEYQHQLKAIDEKLGAEKYQGGKLAASKIGDQLIKYNQYRTLGFNPFSGLNNVLFGIISAHIHANGKRDFTRAELMAAYKSTSASSLKWASFGTVESNDAHKMLNIMDRLGIIGDYIDHFYGKVKVRERKSGLRKVLDPFTLMRSGDYFMKALTTKAMLLHDKVEVTEGGVKKSIPLWEALNKDGEWDSKRFGDNKDWSSENVEEQKKWDKFRNRAVRVNMIIHGNQDRNAPKLINKTVLGRMLGQFRMSWLPEGWNSRWQKEHFDIQLDRDVKGRYLTFGELGIGGSIQLIFRQTMSIFSKVDPYTGVRRSDGKALSDVDIENMRRNFSELGFMLGTAALMLGVKSLLNNDDAKKKMYQFTLNMILRSQQDITFYSSPQTFDNITRNIIPATQVFDDGIKAAKATGRLMFDSDYEFMKWEKAMGRMIPYASQIVKAQYMINQDLSNLQH